MSRAKTSGTEGLKAGLLKACASAKWSTAVSSQSHDFRITVVHTVENHANYSNSGISCTAQDTPGFYLWIWTFDSMKTPFSRKSSLSSTWIQGELSGSAAHRGSVFRGERHTLRAHTGTVTLNWGWSKNNVMKRENFIQQSTNIYTKHVLSLFPWNIF